MVITEQQLRDIISETIKESLFGYSFHNLAKNGHARVDSKSNNPIIRKAWRLGWELSKEDEGNIYGEYTARIMNGYANNVEPDEGNIDDVKYPKASWPMLIAKLNQEFRPQGYFIKGSKYHRGYENLMGKETTDGGAEFISGIITVERA